MISRTLLQTLWPFFIALTFSALLTSCGSSNSGAETSTNNTDSSSQEETNTGNEPKEGSQTGNETPPTTTPALLKISIEEQGKVFSQLGGTHTFTAKAVNSIGEEVEPTLTWHSSNTEVIHLDEASGQVTALKRGSATVHVSAEGLESNPVLVVVTEYQPGLVLLAADDIASPARWSTGTDIL